MVQSSRDNADDGPTRIVVNRDLEDKETRIVVDEPASTRTSAASRSKVIGVVGDDQQSSEESRDTIFIPTGARQTGSDDAALGEDMQLGPVVGCLYVTKGPGRGCCLKIRYGPNTMGRGSDQKIRLTFGANAQIFDEQVSNSHVVLHYEKRNRTFWIEHKSQICYCNGEVVKELTEVKDRDVISLGETDLVLSTFCGPHFDWLESNESN